MKLQAVEAADWIATRGRAFLHYCPGCRQMHLINIEKPNHCGATWTFNGDVERPTFTPSVNIVGRCHYNITNGTIQYHGDSTHALAGQTIPMPEIPEDML